MTYCLAIKVDDGFVFASDSRTSAGMDHISKHSKMYAFTDHSDRTFILLSSGNLATTQGVVDQIRRDLYDLDNPDRLKRFNHLFDLADYIGQINRRIQDNYHRSPQQGDIKFGASYILGGQISNQEHEMFLIYPEGNYISVSPAKPYLQIGETKYGKPILDRFITPDTSLEDAARSAVVSLDSTIHSSPSVGPPFELAIYRKDSFKLEHQTLDIDSIQYQAMTQGWNEGLKCAFIQLPRFEWEH